VIETKTESGHKFVNALAESKNMNALVDAIRTYQNNQRTTRDKVDYKEFFQRAGNSDLMHLPYNNYSTEEVYQAFKARMESEHQKETELNKESENLSVTLKDVIDNTIVYCNGFGYLVKDGILERDPTLGWRYSKEDMEKLTSGKA